MLIVQAAAHPDDMPVAARLALQPTVPAALALPQHPPTAHFVSTASHNCVTRPSNANRGHYSPFGQGSKPQFTAAAAGKRR